MKSKADKSKPVENPYQEPLVLVKWVDSVRGDGWQFLSEIVSEPVVCYTIGWLLTDTQDYVTICSTMAKNQLNPDQGCSYITIPKVAIVDITVYRP